MKIWACHKLSGEVTKRKFRQVCHSHIGVTNYSKLYSNTWTTIFMFSNKWNDQEYQKNEEDKSNISFLFVQFAA